MKKFIASALIIILAASLFFACGGDGGATGKTPGETIANAPKSAPSNAQKHSAKNDSGGSGENEANAAKAWDGVISFDGHRIEITGHRLIPVGSPEHGSAFPGKRILVTMFSYTNNGSKEKEPAMGFSYVKIFGAEEMTGADLCFYTGYPDEYEDAMQFVAPGDSVEGAICHAIMNEETDKIFFHYFVSGEVMTLDLTGL